MKIIVIGLLAIFGLGVSLPSEKANFKILDGPKTIVNDSLKGKATYLYGPTCDHNSQGYPVIDVKGKLIELGSGTTHDVVSDINGEFCYPTINNGLISYEGKLPNRFYTDHILTNPVLGVSAYDLGKIQQHISDFEVLCSYTRLIADANCDGEINQDDIAVLQERLSATVTGYVPPFQYFNWMIMPKLSTVPSLTHPDQQYLSDFWNIGAPVNTPNDFPFAAELNVLGDHYEYAESPYSWKGKIQQWGYSNQINNCDASFDFYVGKTGEVTGGSGTSISNYLNGVFAGNFGINCNTPGDERYFDVIPYEGGFLAVGEALSSTAGNQMDVLVTKMNKYAEIIWSKTIGGTGDELARSVVETTDGSLFITANTNSVTTTREDLYVIKMDTDGNVLFENTFEGTFNSLSNTGAFGKGIQTSDGGFIIGAHSANFLFSGHRSCYVLRLNAAGQLQWAQHYGFFDNEQITSIIQTQDGGFVFSGITESFGVGFNDILLTKISSSGSVLWSKTIGTTSNDGAGTVQELANGNLILCGDLGEGQVANNTISKGLIMELTASGNEVWSKVYYGGKRDIIRQVIPVNNGYIVLASSNSFVSNNLFDVILFKITNTGTIIWTQQYGEEGQDEVLLSGYPVGEYDFVFGGYLRHPDGNWNTYMLKTNDFGHTYIDCYNQQPFLSSADANVTINTAGLAQLNGTQQFSFNGTTSPFELPCYRYCGENGTPPSSNVNNNIVAKTLSGKSSKRNISTDKIRVSIQSKYPISVLGFEAKIDNDLFTISNVKKERNALTKNMTASNHQKSRADGIVRVISYIGSENEFKPVDCKAPISILEIEGKLNGKKEKLDARIEFNTQDFPAEIISNGELIAAEDYKIIFEWIN